MLINRCLISCATCVMLFLSTASQAQQCRFGGKTVVIEYGTCPLEVTPGLQRTMPTRTKCTRDQRRLTFIGDSKVAVSDNLIEAKGFVYTIGEKLGVVQGDDNYDELRRNYPLDSNAEVKVSLDASHSIGQLKLSSDVQLSIVRPRRFLASRQTRDLIVEFSEDCSTCKVLSYYEEFENFGIGPIPGGKGRWSLREAFSCAVKAGF